MAFLHLVPNRTRREPRSLRLTDEPEPGTSLAEASEDGVVRLAQDSWDEEARALLCAELRAPEVLVDQVERDLDSEATRTCESSWHAARLFLAVHRALTETADLRSEIDRWTRTLLLLLQARASLRAFANGQATDPRPWHRRAAEDLLDAAAAVAFFEPAQLTPFLHFLVAVLPRDRARQLLDDLLPVDSARFAERLVEGEHRQLARVVQGVAHAQRRQWCLGRYDLAGASRFAPLLARLRFPRGTVAACFWRAGMRGIDLLVPRLFAGILVGTLPVLLTEEAWVLASTLPFRLVAFLSALTLVAVFFYLAYDRRQADPAGLTPFGGVGRVWLIGLLEAFGLSLGVQMLAAESFYRSLVQSVPDVAAGISPGFNLPVFLAGAAFSLGVGVFTQLIWQDEAVTAPP